MVFRYIIMLILLTMSFPLFAGDNLDAEIEQLLTEKTATQEKELEKSVLLDRASTPNIFVTVDMIGDKNFRGSSNSHEDSTSNGFKVRSVEVGLFGGIDYLALGTVNVAIHEENGEYVMELHEAFFEFNTLPFNLFAKVGRFFPDLGRLNSIHQHDWHFTTTPLVHNLFFGEEGILDQGGEVSLLLPWSFYQEIKCGLFNGKSPEYMHAKEQEKHGPLFTARLKHFISLIGELGTQFGFTYFRWIVDEDGREIDHTAGADLTFKWRKGRWQSFIFSTEYWYRYEERSDVVQNHKKHGLYSYVQYQFHQNWLIGTRFDYFAELDVQSIEGNSINQNSFAQLLWLAFRPSEFSYFRLTFERRDEYGMDVSYAGFVQASFILGHHPAHSY